MATRTQITRIQKLEDIKERKDIVYPSGMGAVYEAMNDPTTDIGKLYSSTDTDDKLEIYKPEK